MPKNGVKQKALKEFEQGIILAATVRRGKIKEAEEEFSKTKERLHEGYIKALGKE